MFGLFRTGLTKPSASRGFPHLLVFKASIFPWKRSRMCDFSLSTWGISWLSGQRSELLITDTVVGCSSPSGELQDRDRLKPLGEQGFISSSDGASWVGNLSLLGFGHCSHPLFPLTALLYSLGQLLVQLLLLEGAKPLPARCCKIPKQE